VVNSSLQLSCVSVAADAVSDVSQCVLESSISLTAGAAAVITGRDPTPLPVSIATIQLLSVGDGSSAVVGLSALGCIRL